MDWRDALGAPPWSVDHVVRVLTELGVRSIRLTDAQWLTMCTLEPVQEAIRKAGVLVEPTDKVVC